MAKYTNIFKRHEKKYLITRQQYEALVEKLSDYIVPDEFGQSTLNNIYFDTPDYRLIRASIEKPTVYKEKLRIRSYGHPTADSNVFVELKKKYKGVVYKRRVNMTYLQSILYLCKHQPPPEESQVTREIDYFVKFYKGLRPMVSLFYDRIAYYAKDDYDVRMTFDTNIRFRNKDFDISKGDYGYTLMDESQMILEIKSVMAMPLWLTHALDELKIYPTSYSKYGNAYKLMLSKSIEKDKIAQ
ncbi:MAG: polyphosphate polymerase domain-containing protein [Acutalibacteraceae bacterium]|nr:polyphosphate polymerase domain-containing protein [Acutalibacteraceae bacterium]